MADLYEIYFDIRKKGKAYKTEREYIQDLYAFFDMCIAAAGMFLTGQPADSGGMPQRRHVKELPGTLADAYDSVMRRAKEADWELRQDIRRLLSGGWQYLKERLIYTPYAGRQFCFRMLVRELALSKAEEFLLLSGYAGCYDVKYGQIFADLHGDPSMHQPTLKLALFLYSLMDELPDEQAGRLLHRQSVLLQYFCDVQAVPGKTDTYRFLVNRRTCSFLDGYQNLDQAVMRHAVYSAAEERLQEIYIRTERLEQVQRVMKHILAEDTLLRHLHPASAWTADVLHIYGPPGNGKKLFIKTAAQRSGYGVIFADTARLEGLPPAEIEIYASGLIQESVLLHACLCLMDFENREEAETGYLQQSVPNCASVRYLVRFLSQRLRFFIWLSKEKCQYLLGEPLHLLCVEQPVLTAGERIELWRAYMKDYPLSSRADAVMWANQYILSARGIQEVLKTADFLRIQQGEALIHTEHIRMAVRQQQPNQLGRFAALVPAVYGWEDLVVSPQQKHQMQLICDQLKYRSIVGEEWGFYKKTAYGRGICALLYGAPGTGKTMAVQVIANELGLDLYRVDLSQLVSKYIGETEKNISELFQKAKNINALLFFDEADALFSKRSEVKDSHDRNANAQTAHLLQKLEDYEGIAVLATNYINNIDDAFKRRIKFIIQFAFPQAPVRLKLWKTILPDSVPCAEELDFEYYAEHFELSGSSIKEILTNAAYIAAASKEALANRHIIEAVRLNYAKYGKILSDSDFGYLIES